MREIVIINNIDLTALGRVQGEHPDGTQFGGMVEVPDGAESFTVHMATVSTALTTGAITLRRTNFRDAPAVAFSEALSVSAGVITPPASCVGLGFIVPEITTVEAGEFCRLAFCFTGAVR